MQKTEKIKLDIDLLPEAIYTALMTEFYKTRKNVVYVDDIVISATVEFEE